MKCEFVCAGTEGADGGGGGGVRGGTAGAADVLRGSVSIVQRALVVVRRTRTSVRAPAAAADRPQARIRARASPRQRVPGRPQADLRAAAAEALQDRVHQGADAADPDRAHHPRAAAERGEDAGVRAGEEARGAARHRDPDACAHAARQARGLLHPVQDAETRRLPRRRSPAGVRCARAGVGALLRVRSPIRRQLVLISRPLIRPA